MEQSTDTIPSEDRRMMRRQEQDQERAALRRKRLVRRLAIWGVTIAVLVGAGWGMVKLANNVQLPTTSGTLSEPVTDKDDIFGASDAKVTLVEYSDFQCPACGAFYPIVKKLFDEPELKGQLRLVNRDFPLTQLHANAQLAAQAAQAAASQGKFWPMHDRLFETQSTWSGQSSTGARATFTGYAKDLGLDGERFKRDIDSSEVKARIQTDVESGMASGVNSTPSFFVNGVLMAPPQTYDQFKQFVINGLSAK